MIEMVSRVVAGADLIGCSDVLRVRGHDDGHSNTIEKTNDAGRRLAILSENEVGAR
jgi:hypothetical protein